jgi:hypothetical protein
MAPIEHGFQLFRTVEPSGVSIDGALESSKDFSDLAVLGHEYTMQYLDWPGSGQQHATRRSPS